MRGIVLKRMLLTRDFWSGMLFAAFGHDLRIGSAARVGLGFVPHARDGNLPFACPLMVLLSIMGHWLNRLLPAAKSHFGP